MTYTIGFDIGSSSIKAALIESETGKPIRSIHEPEGEMTISAPQKNWAEQDPDMWWHYVCAASKRLVEESKINPQQIVGIGISYQMHGLVIVDSLGKPLRDAIIWCDSRAVDIGREAYSELGQEFCGSHYLNSPGNFTASKLSWVKENEPAIFDRIHKFMLPGDYIAFKLSDAITTTKNGLSEGILWDFKKNEMSHELLDYFGISADLVPDIVENFSEQGQVSDAAAKETGLVAGIPIIYRSGDQPNNALALNVFEPGEIAATCGTSGVIYACTDHLDLKEVSRINHFAHVNYSEKKPIVGRLLNINGAGILYRWLKTLTGLESYSKMNELAESVPIGSDGLVTLPFGNGAERMFNNQVVGSHLSHLNFNSHQTAHLCRSALEGIAFAFVFGMDLLKKDHTEIKVIRAGNDNLFQSEVFGKTVATLMQENIEIYDTTGAIGAARAAAIKDGNLELLKKMLGENGFVKSFQPEETTVLYQQAYEAWKKELQKHLNTN